MSDLEFWQAFLFSESKYGQNASADFVREAGAQFGGNIERIAGLPYFVAILAGWAGDYQRLFLRAVFSVRGDLGDVEPQHVEAVRQALHQITDKYMASFSGDLADGPSADFNFKCMYEGSQLIEHVSNRPEVRRGIEAIFHAMVVGAWTAFETLAADLWEKCLNNRPRLALAALDAEPSLGDDEIERERKKKVKFSLPAWYLREPGFDLNKKMGTLLEGKWDFARRDDAEDAYIKAFKNSKAQIETIFENEALGWLTRQRQIRSSLRWFASIRVFPWSMRESRSRLMGHW